MAHTSDPARTPQVSRFLLVLDLANFMKVSITDADYKMRIGESIL